MSNKFELIQDLVTARMEYHSEYDPKTRKFFYNTIKDNSGKVLTKKIEKGRVFSSTNKPNAGIIVYDLSGNHKNVKFSNKKYFKKVN